MLPNLAESVLSDEDNYGDNDYDDEYYAQKKIGLQLGKIGSIFRLEI